MKDNIRIYEIKSEYIKYLSNYQKHIFLQTESKNKRKYIGIVFEIGHIKYFAPLSSYKDKHKKMKEGVDFIKIKDLSYRYLLQAVSREVNRQRNRIRKNAGIVYSHKKYNGNSTALAKRTNDFELLEKLCREYEMMIKQGTKYIE